MLNMSDILRGYTDSIILAQLIKHDSYGYEINKQIQKISKGILELKEATLYTTFRRLEAAACIKSYWGDESTGARRRYYSITETGRSLFNENYLNWQQAKEIIENLMQEGKKHE